MNPARHGRPVATIAIALGTLLCVASAAAVRSAGSAKPPGAVVVSPAEIKQVDRVTCGKVHGKWLAGTLKSKKYFVPYITESKRYKQLAARAEGKEKRRYARKARAFKTKHRKETPKCNAGVRFDIKGAIGLILRKSRGKVASDTGRRADSSGSNLDALEPDGDTHDAVASGEASIEQFIIAPNGRVYVLFRQSADLGDGTDCLLAEVPPASGRPICVDSTLDRIAWGKGFVPAGVAANPAIQLDAAGAIYYYGSASGSQQILRRYLNGATTDLINDNIRIWDFLVLSDGRVLITGETAATQARWTRLLTSSGGLQSVVNSVSHFMSPYPDGNVYLGLRDEGSSGVRRYLAATNMVESKYWFARNADAYHDTAEFCEQHPDLSGFCSWDGAVITSSHTTADGQVFAVAGSSGQQGVLMQYFPTLAVPSTSVRGISVAESAGNDLIVAGLNASGRNIVTLYHPATDSETPLIGPDNEIEIYHLNYVAGSDRVLFDGLRFADNKYVLGEIDLGSGQVSFPATSATKWEDFQTFG